MTSHPHPSARLGEIPSLTSFTPIQPFTFTLNSFQPEKSRSKPAISSEPQHCLRSFVDQVSVFSDLPDERERERVEALLDNIEDTVPLPELPPLLPECLASPGASPVIDLPMTCRNVPTPMAGSEVPRNKFCEGRLLGPQDLPTVNSTPGSAVKEVQIGLPPRKCGSVPTSPLQLHEQNSEIKRIGRSVK